MFRVLHAFAVVSELDYQIVRESCQGREVRTRDCQPSLRERWRAGLNPFLVPDGWLGSKERANCIVSRNKRPDVVQTR